MSTLDVGPSERRTPVRRRRLLGAGVLVCALLGWLVIGPTGLLVLAGAAVISVGAGRVFPVLSGPASWAAGVLGALGVSLAASAVVALLSPHTHSRGVNLVVLSLPILAGALLILLGRARRTAERTGADTWPLTPIPIAVTLAGLLVAGAVRVSGQFHGVAWAMSGDARNHVAIMRDLIAGGGLSVGALTEYPAALNAFAALIAGAGARTGAAGAVILNDVEAIASVYVLAGIAAGVLLAGALLEMVPEEYDWARPRALLAPGTLCLGVAAAAASPFFLGVALADGFFSAYGALPLALAAVVLTLRFFRRPESGPLATALVTVALPLVFVAWTVLAVVPFALLVVMVAWTVGGLLRRRSLRGPMGTVVTLAALAAAVVALVLVAAVVHRYWARLVFQFSFPGSSRATHAFMLGVVLLVAVAVAATSNSVVVRRQMLVPAFAGVAGVATVLWLRSLAGPDAAWTYYALKTNWLVAACLFWVPFVPLLLWSTRARPADDLGSRAGTGTLRGVLAAVSAGAALLVLLGSATTAPEPLRLALQGWDQPSAEVVGISLAAADKGEPYVLWEVSDPGNDKLGNFWGVLAWGSSPAGEYYDLPGVPGGLRLWAYFAGSDIQELCTLAGGAPGIDVQTRDPQLADALDAACPAVEADVVEVPAG